MQVLILGRPEMNYMPSWTAKGPIPMIVGIAMNNDGYTKESITFPSQKAQKKLFRQVFTNIHKRSSLQKKLFRKHSQ